MNIKRITYFESIVTKKKNSLLIEILALVITYAYIVVYGRGRAALELELHYRVAATRETTRSTKRVLFLYYVIAFRWPVCKTNMKYIFFSL